MLYGGELCFEGFGVYHGPQRAFVEIKVKDPLPSTESLLLLSGSKNTN